MGAHAKAETPWGQEPWLASTEPPEADTADTLINKYLVKPMNNYSLAKEWGPLINAIKITWLRISI
jgi:hypothetical protein